MGACQFTYRLVDEFHPQKAHYGPICGLVQVAPTPLCHVGQSVGVVHAVAPGTPAAQMMACWGVPKGCAPLVISEVPAMLIAVPVL